tara:strand:- start:38 stop:478 length:441 start_codon:yes stop_codon:yes gene_type:complete
MAQFINFPVTGAFVGGGAAAPQMEGDNLIPIGKIASVTVVTSGAGLCTISMNIDTAAAGSDLITIEVSTDSAVATPTGNAPYVGAANAAGWAAYNARMKDAIIKAMCSNPGGVKSTVGAPQGGATEAALENYVQGNSCFFKSFTVG